MKEILLIVTSPRKRGNNADAAQIVFDEIKTKGQGVGIINLFDYQINRCQGCLSCQKGKKCLVDDNFDEAWKLVKKADTIVYFIPVYWCAPPGLMKDFMDRTVVDFAAGGVMQNKEVHLVSIAQSAGFEPQEEIVDTWIRWLGGTSLKTKMRLVAFHKGELLKNSSAVEELKKFAEKLVS